MTLEDLAYGCILFGVLVIALLIWAMLNSGRKK